MPKLIELGLPSLTPEVYSILASQGIISGSYISRFFFFLVWICVLAFGFDALF